MISHRVAISFALVSLELFCFSGCSSDNSSTPKPDTDPVPVRTKADSAAPAVTNDVASKKETEVASPARRESPTSQRDPYVPPSLVVAPTKTPVEGREGIASIYSYEGEVRLPVLHTSFFLSDEADPKGLAAILNFDPARPGVIVTDSSNPWTSTEFQASCNCHSFTLGESIGLTPRDSLSGSRVRLLGFASNPIVPLLEKHFEQMKSYPKSPTTANDITRDDMLREGDMIFMASGTGPKRDFPHSGRVVKVNGENWILNKWGQRAMLRVPVSTILAYYPHDNIEVWVQKGRAKLVGPPLPPGAK